MPSETSGLPKPAVIEHALVVFAAAALAAGRAHQQPERVRRREPAAAVHQRVVEEEGVDGDPPVVCERVAHPPQQISRPARRRNRSSTMLTMARS